MFKNAYIFKVLKLLIVLLPLVFVVTSCSSDDTPVNASNKTDEELADEHTQDNIEWVDEKGHRRTGGCWQDKILTTLYEAMGTMAMGLYKDLSQGALALEMVAFMIWLSLRLLKFVSAISPENSGEVWNEILKKIFLCLFCGTLASSTEGTLYVLNTFIFPIYNAFLEFGGEILNTADRELANNERTMTVLGFPIEVSKPILCLPAAGGNEATLEGFPEGPLKMMNCMICSLNERLSLGNYISFRILRAPGFWVTINGLILLVTFMIIKLAFVFYLVDNVFKFAVMVVMLPLLVLFYPFQNKWAVFGFKTILSSAAFMMGISIMIAVACKALVQIIVQNPDIFNPAEGRPEEHVNDFSAVFMSLLLLSFMIVSTINVAKEITSAMVDAKIDTNFQQKLWGIALMAIGWLTGGVGKAFGKLAAVQKMQQRYDKSGFARALRKQKKVIETLNRWAGR